MPGSKGFLPQAFCWTKMKDYSGQDLESVIRRKEVERKAGLR